MKRIVLTGYMGTGKSSVGRRLAQRLRYRFVDLDEEVKTDAGLSISDIFAQFGEPHFRRLESAALHKVCSGERLVIATGGGAVIDEENRKLIRQDALVVNLTADAREILARLADENVRPLLKNGKSIDSIQTMLDAREAFYADADVRINTTGKSVEEITETVIAILKEQQGSIV